jgi:hypothetical protein
VLVGEGRVALGCWPQAFLLNADTGMIATDSARGNDGSIFGAAWDAQGTRLMLPKLFSNRGANCATLVK